MKRLPHRRTGALQPLRSRLPWRLSPILYRFIALGSIGLSLALLLPLTQPLHLAAQAQDGITQEENELIREFALPSEPPPAPVYRPAPEPAYQPPAPEPVYIAPEPIYEPPARAYEPPAPAPAEPAAPVGADDLAPAAPETTVDNEPEPDTDGLEQPEDAIATEGNPKPATTGPLNRYVLQFNRSPIVGNRLQMRGVYSERRLGFTRPRGWDVKAVKALIRYQHSPTLRAENSNLLVRVNDTNVGSIPLNEQNSAVGEFLVEIPPELIQDYTEITLIAQQNNSETCSDPADPLLWTEVLPDSKVVLDYQPKAINLDLANFPYPFFDPLALDANQITYVLPKAIDDTWLTAASRFQGGLGRKADYRPLNTSLVKTFDKLAWNDRLVIIGTPENQPLLKELKLPLNQAKGKFVDGKTKQPLPEDVGVVMLASIPKSGNPVLVVSGNGPDGILRAIQALQTQDGEALGSGSISLVTQTKAIPAPEPRAWPHHLPQEDSFILADLATADGTPFQDVTVRSISAPPIEIDFRALPDDHFLRGNALKLNYSYADGLNPRKSTVEVAIDDVTIAGQRLSGRGGRNESFNVSLPENLIKPDSKLRVSFQLSPKDGEACGIANDANLWATLHRDSSFKLSREISVDLPDLALTQVGFPYAAPQDLSATSFVTAANPTENTIRTLLETSERLGRLSRSDADQVNAYLADNLPQEERDGDNLILIGSRDNFPLVEELKQKSTAGNRLVIDGQSLKGKDGTVIQSFPEGRGIIQQIISPWNSERVVLALTGQADSDLALVEQMFEYDTWFLQLEGDTVLVSRNDETVSSLDPNAYELKILQANKVRRLENVGPLSKASRFLQERWLMLPVAVLTLCLMMYGISQIYLKRVGGAK
ncbi:MAG: cellulose biosynthesis cyclic di-GMP-binding regulatory protein BcsB [Synechococcales cyanobacterium RM1_1_8]|nr:cellulose biosynthesis cyclic di-GMP-binding regulatory protein BcsB [Synechococcales cyanobacterium RM1_1_8]